MNSKSGKTVGKSKPRQRRFKSPWRQQARHFEPFVRVCFQVDELRGIWMKAGGGARAALKLNVLLPTWKDAHNDLCHRCESGGKLLCCDFCNCVYHPQCLDPPMKTLTQVTRQPPPPPILYPAIRHRRPLQLEPRRFPLLLLLLRLRVLLVLVILLVDDDHPFLWCDS